MEQVLGRSMRRTRDQAEYDLSRLKSCRLFGLFFLRSNCPACDNFAHKLHRFHEDVNMDGLHFEVLAVPSENDDGLTKAFTAQFNWMGFAGSDAKVKDLYQKHKVAFVPSLVVLDMSGNVVSTEGRAEVTRDGEQAFEAWLRAASAPRGD